MLRASWPLLSHPFPRLERPAALPRLWRQDRTFLPRFWRQDRFLASSLKSWADKGPSSINGFKPDQQSDDASDGALDTFTPSASASFRFPPFPLALVEDSAPKISPEPEQDSDTDIFEASSPEYRVYERLPQPSADILTQVARSLPELLPEPETDFDSIFEDKWHMDYTAIPTLSSPPVTSTQSLEKLVADKNYTKALRVLDELLQVGTEIPHSFSYERAAISAVKVAAQTPTQMDEQIQTFKKWFSLIPRADNARPRTFRLLLDRIMLSPLNSLRLFMEFGLIAAEKGFASSTHYRVTSFLSMYGDPSATMQYLDELRRRNRVFLEGSSQKSADLDALDRKFHGDIIGVAVRTLAAAGRLDDAVQLVPDPLETIVHLTPYTYNFLLSKLQATNDPRYLPHINFVAQHKSEARFRSTGVRRIPDRRLGLAIRCLASVGEFDLALDLLPVFQKTKLEPIIYTLDVLYTKLEEVQDKDGRHHAYLEHISQLRGEAAASPLAPPADGEDSYGRAIEALTRAWCLDEALALIPAFHQRNTRHVTRIYNLLLWKFRASCNPRYNASVQWIKQLNDETLELARQAKTKKTVANKRVNVFDKSDAKSDLTPLAETWATRRLADLDDTSMFASVTSKPPRRVKQDLAAALRALRTGFRSLLPSQRPHPLTVARFMELYLASGRTRAIPLLRNFVLRGTMGTSSYILAEMLFHARRREPDLVIRTFVTHFYIVGLPRDELIIRLSTMEPPEPDIWAAHPSMKLYPDNVHAAVVWRALLELHRDDERALEDLYSKLLKFADPTATKSSVLHPGVPLLPSPPAWKTGVAASAFTPYIRRMCAVFGAARGALVLKDMFNVGIMPTIHQLTEVAMEYSRSGDVARTIALLNQMEAAASVRDSADADAPESSRVIPRVDQVFYVAIIRGFLSSGQIAAAKEVESQMHRRYDFVPGKNKHLDQLYADLKDVERGESRLSRLPPMSAVHNTTSKAPQEATENDSNSLLEVAHTSSSFAVV